MAAKEIAVKKYVVRLSADERAQLGDLIHKGKRAAQLLTKARILLKADVSEAGEGWSDSRIAEALDTSIASTRPLSASKAVAMSSAPRISKVTASSPRVWAAA